MASATPTDWHQVPAQGMAPSDLLEATTGTVNGTVPGSHDKRAGDATAGASTPEPRTLRETARSLGVPTSLLPKDQHVFERYGDSLVKHMHTRTRHSNTAGVLAFSSLMPPIIRDGRHRYEYNVGKREWVTAAFPAAFPAGAFRGCVAKHTQFVTLCLQFHWAGRRDVELVEQWLDVNQVNGFNGPLDAKHLTAPGECALLTQDQPS